MILSFLRRLLGVRSPSREVARYGAAWWRGFECGMADRSTMTEEERRIAVAAARELRAQWFDDPQGP